MTNKTITVITALCLFIFTLTASADGIVEAENALKAGNYELALKTFKPMAEAGNPEAMLGMGRIYRGGMGVEKNPKIAIEWFGKAVNVWNERARAGDPRAYASLGIMFQKGLGFKKDTIKAQEYYRYAFDAAQPKALQGDVESQHLLGTLYSSGKGVPKDIFASVDWLGKAGEAGHQTSIKMLIHIYTCACRGLPKDEEKERYWRAKLTGQ